MEGPVNPNEQKLESLYSKLEACESMSERVAVALEIIDVCIQIGRPREDIIADLNDWLDVATNEHLDELTERIETKIKELE